MNWIEIFSPKGVWIKAKEKNGKNLVVAEEVSIHKLWLLLGGRGVSGRNRKGVPTAHNWWSVEYETAASVLLNSIKELGSPGLS